MKKMNKKGFTLAELLIVVAIIAVLVAIMIPLLQSQLERSREAADLSNIRAAYSEAMTTMLETGDSQAGASVHITQHTTGWIIQEDTDLPFTYAPNDSKVSGGMLGANGWRPTKGDYIIYFRENPNATPTTLQNEKVFMYLAEQVQ